ncbi:hypothetical protein D9M69_519460 [compost metagenome]
MRGGAHDAVGAALELRRHRVDQRGLDQRFIALHIDHRFIVGQAEQGAGFGQAVAARRVVGAGQQDRDAMGLAGLHDADIVRGHHAAGGVAQPRALGHAHHHGQARDVGQGFVGQAARRQPGRDQDGEARVLGGAAHGSGAGAGGRAASSSVRVRATCSSRIGMPSRTG